MSENYFETKRLYELSKTQCESSKLEYDKIIGDLRRRHTEEINDIVADNHKLQMRIEDAGKHREQ